MKYKQFIFDSYQFDASTGQLDLQYSMDDQLLFTEKYRFAFPFADYSAEALDRALQLLFFIAGVSYFKTYLPSEIVVRSGEIDTELADFLSKTYSKGLGEFFYVNQLDPNTSISFPANTEKLNTLSISGAGKLVGLGGGKDSLVSVELLRGLDNITTWAVGHEQQLQPLVALIDLPHLRIERQWDKQLLKINEETESYNGHIPISAVLACVGVVVAILSGKKDVVVSNEQSANEPTLTYKGHVINHQYSKSQEFEQDIQEVLKNSFGESIRYYSLLRPLSELRIAELFSEMGFEKYKHVFTSCNRAFTHGKTEVSWCGECPKCAFVFLALTPFVEQKELEELFGKNLLLDQALENTYRQLLGISGDKPLDCVGEIKECRAAMHLAQNIYPELKKYTFDLPESYDFRALASHEVPKDVWEDIKQSFVTQTG